MIQYKLYQIYISLLLEITEYQQYYTVQPTAEQLKCLQQLQARYDEQLNRDDIQMNKEGMAFEYGYLTGAELYKIEKNGQTIYQLVIDDDSRLLIKNPNNKYEDKYEESKFERKPKEYNEKTYIYEQMKVDGNTFEKQKQILKEECQNYKMRHIE